MSPIPRLGKLYQKDGPKSKESGYLQLIAKVPYQRTSFGDERIFKMTVSEDFMHSPRIPPANVERLS